MDAALPIAVTSGEPAGIGPDLCAIAATRRHAARLVFLGDRGVIESRAKGRGLALDLPDYAPGSSAPASLLHVAANGTVETLAAFPTQANPIFPFGPPTIESVPTTVARGPDGALYVGELTGFPFVQGLARIFRVVPGQSPVAVCGGFKAIIDVAFAPELDLGRHHAAARVEPALDLDVDVERQAGGRAALVPRRRGGGDALARDVEVRRRHEASHQALEVGAVEGAARQAGATLLDARGEQQVCATGRALHFHEVAVGRLPGAEATQRCAGVVDREQADAEAARSGVDLGPLNKDGRGAPVACRGGDHPGPGGSDRGPGPGTVSSGTAPRGAAPSFAGSRASPFFDPGGGF